MYVRVSTTKKVKDKDSSKPDTYEQNVDMQIAPLKEYINSRQWGLFKIYQDRMSGAKEDRPGLKQLMEDARRALFDVVIVWRFDRFARSSRQLILALEEFQGLHIDFVSYSEALDTSTPMGKAMFTIISAMAELERNIIRERVLAGMAHAMIAGTKSGKAIGRPKGEHPITTIKELRDSGLSFGEIAKKLGITRSAAYRSLQV